MRLVAIDIGNSKTRIGLFQEGELVKSVEIPTDPFQDTGFLLQAYQQHLDENIHDIPIFAASVVSEITEKIQDDVTLINDKSPLDFSIDRVDPQTLGPDIIAASQAVVKLYHVPAIIIDAGTATTITYINDKKIFLGGVICPGLGISAQALFNKASALDPVAFKAPPSVIANTTETAIQAGLMFGHTGMIESIASRIQKEEGLQSTSVICTGGAMQGLLDILPTSYMYDPELVLKGVASIAMNHFTH